MPMPRRYANPAQRQAAYRQRVADALRYPQELRETRERPLPPRATQSHLPSTRRWVALTQHARATLRVVQEELKSYYDERSEAWQASERGEACEERLELAEAASEAVEELLGSL